MQIDQLFEFVYVLIGKKQVTAKAMAQRFGVSVRTIYRWVEALSLSGIPLYSLKGRGGGIAISEKYSMDNTLLSEDERLAILSSLKALNALSGNPSSLPDANSKAVEKLSHLVTSDADWLQVDFAPWSPEGSEVRNLFSLLRDSILKKRQVSFDYFTGDGRSEKRIIHPWKLIFRGQAWYLWGWCTTRQAQRYFKLTRMRNVQMTGRTATIPKPAAPQKTLATMAPQETQTVPVTEPATTTQKTTAPSQDSAAYATKSASPAQRQNCADPSKKDSAAYATKSASSGQGRMPASPATKEPSVTEPAASATKLANSATKELRSPATVADPVASATISQPASSAQGAAASSTKSFPLLKIKARVAKEKIPYLLDSFICSQLVTHKDGSLTATFTAPESPWLCELLLGFGPQIKILSPKKIRETIIELSKSVTNLYKD
ncbi:MAG: WYL domain-containing protein [Treponemataceae bacterium]|nr:WYL domain-containing protein [Treponemataceae bacterium]